MLRLTHRAAERSIHQLFLHTLHLGRARLRLVVIAMEMEEAMRDIETQLVVEGCPKLSGLAFRGLGADEYFPVLKRDHVGWAGFIHESRMNPRDPPIRNEDDVHLRKRRENAPFSARQFQAGIRDALRKLAQGRKPDVHHPLAVRQNNIHLSGRCSA